MGLFSEVRVVDGGDWGYEDLRRRRVCKRRCRIMSGAWLTTEALLIVGETGMATAGWGKGQALADTIQEMYPKLVRLSGVCDSGNHDIRGCRK